MLTLHHVIECTQKRSELSVQYGTHRCIQKIVADVGMMLSDYERINDLHQEQVWINYIR